MPKSEITNYPRMIDLSDKTIAEYLFSRNILSENDQPHVSQLRGGVSCRVFRVVSQNTEWVVKQALSRLDVKEEWLADPKRLLREGEAMKILSKRVRSARIPQILVEDADNCIIIMTAVDSGARNFKSELLSGNISASITAAAGRALREIHDWSGSNAVVFESFDDAHFKQLRIEPYYRWLLQRHSWLEPLIETRISQMMDRKMAMVHGDYSPKNMLIDSGNLYLLDFEVAHWGDPAFDIAFFLNHLVLKYFHLPVRRGKLENAISAFLEAYFGRVTTNATEEARREAALHLPILMLARIDGKSPVEYLDTHNQELLREAAGDLLRQEITELEDLISRAFQYAN